MNVVESSAQQQLDKAQALLQRLQQHTDPAYEEHLCATWLRKAQALHALARYAEAADTCMAFISYSAGGEGGPRARWIAEAWARRGFALHERQDAQGELACYAELRKRFDGATVAEVRVWLATATLHSQLIQSRVDSAFSKVKAVHACDELAKRFGNDAALATQLIVARARLWRAALLGELDYHAQEMEAYGQIDALLGASPEAQLRAMAIQARYEQSLKLGVPTAAITLLDAVLARHGVDRAPEVRAWLAAVSVRRAGLLDEQGRRDEALGACHHLLADFSADADARVALECCKALQLQAHVLRSLGRSAGALAAIDRLIADHGHRPEPEIRAHLASTLYQRTWLIDDPEARCAACDLMSEMLDAQPDGALDVWRMDARLLKAEIEQHRQLPQASMLTLETLIERFEGRTEPELALRLVRARLANAANCRELGQHAQAQVLCLAVADELEVGFAQAGPEMRLEGVRALTQFFDGLGPDEHTRRVELVGWLLERYGRDDSAKVRRLAVVRAYDWAVGLREQGDIDTAMSAYDWLLAVFLDDGDDTVSRTVSNSLLNKANLLFDQLDRPQEAFSVYEQVMVRLRGTTSPELQETLAKATAGRIACLKKLKKPTAAEVVAAGGAPELPATLRDGVREAISRARKRGDAGEPREAVALFDQVLAAHAESPHPELRRQCARATLLKAYWLLELQRFDQLIELAHEVDVRYGAEVSLEMQEKVALAFQYKSTAFDKLGRHDDERKVLDEIVMRWGSAEAPELRGRVAGALFRKGVALRQAGNFEEAIGCYDQVVLRTAEAKEPAVQLWAAKSLINKAKALEKRGDVVGQVAAYRELIARFSDSDEAALRERVVNAGEWLAEAEGRRGQHEAQRAVLEDILGRYGTQMPPEQQTRMSRELATFKVKALGRKAREAFDRVLKKGKA